MCQQVETLNIEYFRTRQVLRVVIHHNTVRSTLSLEGRCNQFDANCNSARRLGTNEAYFIVTPNRIRLCASVNDHHLRIREKHDMN